MTRSYHTTHRDIRLAIALGTEAIEEPAAIVLRIQRKRRTKRSIRRERRDLAFPVVLPGAKPAIRIENTDHVWFPASADDIQAVIDRLPKGTIDGLTAIELSLGESLQRGLPSPIATLVKPDPLTGRLGLELVPGLFAPLCLGIYHRDRNRIGLFGYVADRSLREDPDVALLLRARMLRTLLHEIAHHEDRVRRVRRGRWSDDSVGPAEQFAERRAEDWFRSAALPYLQTAYPGSMSAVGILLPLRVPSPHDEIVTVHRELARVDLFLDRVENPHNVDALRTVAQLFGADMLLAGDRLPAQSITCSPELQPDVVSAVDLRRRYEQVVALETGASAESLYRARLPNKTTALVVGNERRGVDPKILRLADLTLTIPMREQGVQSLNVASAAAAAFYHLRTPHRRRPGTRPDLLLVDPADPAELGTTLRTAWALGWHRLFIRDSHHLWQSASRTDRAITRGAARRHRNPLRVLPFPPDRRYDVAWIVRIDGRGAPLARAALPSRSIVVLPDESNTAVPAELAAIARVIVPVTLALPGRSDHYRYRIPTAITLTEIARRVGQGSLSEP